MRLEDFVKDNYEEFNDHEPVDGHFERFETKLKRNREPQYFSFKPYYWVAAFFIGLVIVSSLYFNYQVNLSKDCIPSEEIQNIQNYYAAQMNEEIEKLQFVLEDVTPDIRTKIIEDVQTMKNDSEKLPATFCKGPNNKKAIAVIITHYEAKIKAIRSITIFMKENKRSTNA